jgi:hypothetical protein
MIGIISEFVLKIRVMNLPAASCRVSKLIIFYPLTLALSPRRGNMRWPCSELVGIFKLKIVLETRRKINQCSDELTNGPFSHWLIFCWTPSFY